MARTIVFPSRNNVTYRSGFIKLSAFGSEFNQAEIEGHTENVVDKLKNTARQTSPDFDGEGIEYLKNAVENMYTERSKMSGELKFVAIMPLPLAVQETTGIQWNSSPSSFIDGAYGKIKDAGIGQSSTYSTATTLMNAGGNYVGIEGAGDRSLNWAQNSALALGSGNQSLVEYINNAHNDLSRAVANSPAANAYLKPGQGTKQILGMNSDKSLMEFHNEAAALNGTRQVIFDPGYWQSFQGVEPRQFTLTWDIIPENHEDAINGLEMCARLREYSLPQSVSGVELLSPCYWQIDWSNEYLDAQTLYSNLVITNIQIDYAQNGEWHGASTPKMFRISISFSEAKAPTADIYKYGDNFIEVSTAARGVSKGRGRRGGKSGNPGYNGSTGTLGSNTSIPFPNPTNPTNPIDPNNPIPTIPGTNIPIPQAPPGTNKKGTIWDIFDGSILDKIKSQVGSILGNIVDGIIKNGGDILGDKIDDWLGNIGNGKIVDVLGDFIDKAVDNASTEASKVLRDAIKSGDFSNLSEKLKDAVLKVHDLDDIANKIGGEIGNKIPDIVDLNDDEIAELLGQISNGDLDEEAINKIKEIIKKKFGDKFKGLLQGKGKPDVVEIINKPSILLGS